MISALLWLISGELIEFKLVFAVAAMVGVFWYFRFSSTGLAIAAVIAGWVGANYLARKGWEAKAAKDARDAGKLIDRSVKARQKAEAAVRAAPDRLRDDDGFRRD